MIIRKAEKSELGDIMTIVDEARAYFASSGIPQWQGEYPSRRDFEEDIDGDRLYVAVDSDIILGVYCYDTRGDANYNEIFDGRFVSDEPYAAIHRVAVASSAKGRGIAVAMAAHAEEKAWAQGFRYMRGDTHRLNISMQRMLTKSGFVHRGIIYLDGIKDSENERFAFDKVIE